MVSFHYDDFENSAVRDLTCSMISVTLIVYIVYHEYNLRGFIMNLFSLEGKVAIVTGARTGLGQGIAVALAKAGADIVGVYFLNGNRGTCKDGRQKVFRDPG